MGHDNSGWWRGSNPRHDYHQESIESSSDFYETYDFIMTSLAIVSHLTL